MKRFIKEYANYQIANNPFYTDKEYKDNYIIVVPYVNQHLYWAYTREDYRIVAHAETEQELKEKIAEYEKKA